MPQKVRTEPDIPDHEVLRKIGGGAYGEVWMARGVTGVYRAVKVVWREDFEDERGFEREFDGILKFEPISRDHPGLVNILHVGRSRGEDAFYYYVMELGDDILSGHEINPVEYEARTLRSDITRAQGKAQAVGPCIEAGIRLAEALAHLHEQGLSHRDVKPANVIFVGGKAKLADIGLVATSGQRTFVGTEGFVPPEGPGSAQADVYSLGKVLYEVATGKDRLQFPELPEELHPETEAKQWHGLNQVICDICEPKISKRTITTAKQLAEALHRLKDGKKVKKAMSLSFSSLILWGLLLGFTGYAMYLAKPYFIEDEPIKINDPISSGNPVEQINGGDVPNGGDVVTIPPDEERYCKVYLIIDPSDAFVYSEDGVTRIGEAQSHFNSEFERGSIHSFIFKAEGYQDMPYTLVVPNEPSEAVDITMKLDQPPILNKKWYDSIGMEYQPVGKGHESSFVTYLDWQQYLENVIDVPKFVELEHKYKNGKVDQLVLLDMQVAKEFAEWITKRSIQDGRLTEDQELVAKLVEVDSVAIKAAYAKDQVLPVKIRVINVPYAELNIDMHSSQHGAKVYIDGELVGAAPDTWTKVKLGKKSVTVMLDGFKKFTTVVDFKENDKIHLPQITLEKNDSLIFGKPWTNKLGMQFVPISDSLMASKWETRVSDYSRYIVEKELKMPNLRQNNKPNEPVVSVSVKDAIAFAEWLTERDRKKGLITENHSYRLPSDREWSRLVGVDEPEGKSIPTLAFTNQDVFPWEGGWGFKDNKLVPLVENAQPVGNFCDEIRKKYNRVIRSYLKGYNDGNSGTSEVGIYPANQFGIHDLAGNVSEWVSDKMKPNSTRHVARGSNYKSFLKKELSVAWRAFPSKDSTQDSIGFRLVLEYEEPTVE